MTSSNCEVAVVDYHAGNLTSVVKALHQLDANLSVTSDPDIVYRAAKIVLPGVGHFAATQFLTDRGLSAAIHSRILEGAPFLGICVGLQWLFKGSTEAPDVAGGGFFSGRCERFVTTEKVPHVGWNSLVLRPGSSLMKDVADQSYAYFTHSYRAVANKETVAVTDYGGPFAAAVESENIMGVQFHPEKSGAVGLTVLKNFVEF